MKTYKAYTTKYNKLFEALTTTELDDRSIDTIMDYLYISKKDLKNEYPNVWKEVLEQHYIGEINTWMKILND